MENYNYLNASYFNVENNILNVTVWKIYIPVSKAIQCL